MDKAILVYRLGDEVGVRIKQYDSRHSCAKIVERMKVFNYTYGEEIFKDIMWNTYEDGEEIK